MSTYFERREAKLEEIKTDLQRRYNPVYERYTWEEIMEAEDDREYLEALAQQMRG